jgi:hypothetical protein
MAYYRTRTISRMGKAQAPTANSYTVPASVNGINALGPLMGMAAEDCISCSNLMPSEYGMELRQGYKEWSYNLSATLPTTYPVNTLIGFEGQAEDADEDRLWGVTEEGIWDITTEGDDAPAQVVTFTPPPGVHAGGFGTSIETTNDAGRRYLQYADEANGLFQYSEDTGLWEDPTDLTAAFDGSPDEFVLAEVAFVMSWKNRIWYIMRSSGDAWYLPPDQISGVVKLFTFGSKFTHGGEMKALYNWTVDGGSGVDDMLIAISRGGDILVYQGVDPESIATFSLVGSWYIGELPESRRIGLSVGGELYVLSTAGIVNLRDLLKGEELTGTTLSGSPAARLSRLLRPLLSEFKDSHVWAMEVYPAEDFLQIVIPYSVQRDALQFNQNLDTKAWGSWTGVPINCSTSWNGRYMIGDINGRIWEHTGVLDGVELPTRVNAFLGEPVSFRVLTSFQPPGGASSLNHIVTLIRAVGLTGGNINLNLAAAYDYAIPDGFSSPPVVQRSNTALWGLSDVPPPDPEYAIWDNSEWPGELRAGNIIKGTGNIGRMVGIAMTGSASERITFAGWDVSYIQGGFL